MCRQLIFATFQETGTNLLYLDKMAGIVWIYAYCCGLQASHVCMNAVVYVYTFIVHKILIFFLHNSQKYCNFASDLKKTVTLVIKPKLFMKTDLFTLKMQAQDFLLRLFIESNGDSTLSSPYYTCAHAGTHARLHQ